MTFATRYIKSAKCLNLKAFTAILFVVWLLFNSSSMLAQNRAQQNELKQKIERISKEVNIIKAHIDTVAPVSHELHDYFAESSGIIERLLGYVEIDIANGELLAAKISVGEAEFLSSYLKEEIMVAVTNDTSVFEEIDVTKHGLKGDGIFNNKEPLEKLISSFKESEKRVKLVFPSGKYFIKGKSGESALNLVNLENLVFKGLGNATLLFDGSVVSDHFILIENCKNLEFKNLSMDVDTLICTLGEITSVESSNKIVIKIDTDYPLPDPSYWTAKILRGLVRNPENGKMIRGLGDPRVINLEDLGDRKYRLTLDNNALSGNPNMTNGFLAGQLFSLHPRARPGSGSTLSIYDSEHLKFSHFNIYAGDGHLVMVSGSAGVKFLDCDIKPKEGRVIMNNADGFHCRSNKKGLYLERCRVMDMNDDCMNFYSKLNSVGEVKDDNKFTLLVYSKAKTNYRVGDNIAFLNANTGAFDKITTVKEIKTVRWGNQTDLIQIETAEKIPGIISRRNAGRPDEMSGREYTESGGDAYRKAMALKAPFEHMVLNLSFKNDGFIVRNSEFGYNRATGFKCKATNGVMRNSVFHDQVILFKTGMEWLEGTFPSKIEMTDVTIDKGIRYFGGLPGKNIPTEQAVEYMEHVKFTNVVDENGLEIPAPNQIK